MLAPFTLGAKGLSIPKSLQSPKSWYEWTAVESLILLLVAYFN